MTLRLPSTVWNARSDKFNDPFEKHPYLYDWNIDKLMMDWNMSWLEYTNDLHNHTYLCSFSETNTSISMWAHYANGFQGYCLEYEVLDAKDLWQVTYDWGRHRFGYEYTEINFAYQNNIISKKERDYQLQTLHKFWSSFKSHDWEYEKEVRAIHYYPDTDSYGVNIDISDIGLKIKSIIIGWDCSDYNREKLIAIANNLNIPIKLAELNMSGTENTRYIKISDYFNESVDKNNHSNQEKALK